MPDVTYERMAGSLGSLLLLWAAIERAAREEIVRACGFVPKSAHGIAAALRMWKDTVSDPLAGTSLNSLLAEILCEQLRQPLAVRNGLCHGLIGIASADGSIPGRLLWQLDGTPRDISWEQLQDSFVWLSKVPDAISMISRYPSETRCDRTLDSVENRQWWRAEFGIGLP